MTDIKNLKLSFFHKLDKHEVEDGSTCIILSSWGAVERGERLFKMLQMVLSWIKYQSDLKSALLTSYK